MLALAAVALLLLGQGLDIPNRAQREQALNDPTLPAQEVNPLAWDENYYVRIAHSQAQGQWLDPCWPSHDPRPQRWDHPPLARIILTASVALFDPGVGTFGGCFFPGEAHDYGYTCYTDVGGREHRTGRACMGAFTDDMREHGNPWAWRMPGALMGTLAVACAALATRRLLGSTTAGLLAGSLLLLDGVFFVQARMATLDIYATGFAALAVYLATYPNRKGTLAAAVALGLAFASKNTAFMAGLPVLAAHLFARHRAGRLSLRSGMGASLAIAVIPGLVWVASYLPWWYLWTRDQGLGFAVEEWVRVQRASLQWNAYTPKPLHPERAQPHTWFLLHQPMFYLRSGRWPDGALYIMAMPNPVLWWGAALASLGGVGFAARRMLLGSEPVPSAQAVAAPPAHARGLGAQVARWATAATGVAFALLGALLALGATADAGLLLLALPSGALAWSLLDMAWRSRAAATWRWAALAFSALLAGSGLFHLAGAHASDHDATTWASGAALLAAGAIGAVAVHGLAARPRLAGAAALAAALLAAGPWLWGLATSGESQAGGLLALAGRAPDTLMAVAILCAALALAGCAWRVQRHRAWTHLLAAAAAAATGVALSISGSALLDVLLATLRGDGLAEAFAGGPRAALVGALSLAVQVVSLLGGALVVAAAALHILPRLQGTPAEKGAVLALVLLPLCYASYFVLVLQSFIYYFMVGIPFLAVALGAYVWTFRDRPEAFGWLGGGIFVVLFGVTLRSLSDPALVPGTAYTTGMTWAGLAGVAGLAGWAYPRWSIPAARVAAGLLLALALASFLWMFPVLEGLPVGEQRARGIIETLPWVASP